MNVLKSILIVLGSVLLMCILADWWKLRTGSRSDPLAELKAMYGKREEAYLTAQDYVRKELKTPSRAEFPSFSDKMMILPTGWKFVVTGVVDSQNSYGAMLRSTYFCDIVYNPITKKWSDGKVQLVEGDLSSK